METMVVTETAAVIAVVVTVTVVVVTETAAVIAAAVTETVLVDLQEALTLPDLLDEHNLDLQEEIMIVTAGEIDVQYLHILQDDLTLQTHILPVVHTHAQCLQEQTVAGIHKLFLAQF